MILKNISLSEESSEKVKNTNFNINEEIFSLLRNKNEELHLLIARSHETSDLILNSLTKHHNLAIAKIAKINLTKRKKIETQDAKIILIKSA